MQRWYLASGNTSPTASGNPQALVADDELHAVQAASTEPLEEADPVGLVLLHPLGGTQNLCERRLSCSAH